MCRRFWILVLAVLLTGLAVRATAAVYGLEDGTTVEGDVISTGEEGVMFRQPDGEESARISWVKFSQAGLKELRKNPRCAKYVEPFIDVDVQKKIKRKAVTIVEWPKLERTAGNSMLGSFFFGTGIGLLALFLIYVANIYAAYEIAIVRAYPWLLVCGSAAVAPFVGPIVFLCLPTRIKSQEQVQSEQLAADEALAAEAAAAEAAAPEGEAAQAAPAAPAAPQYPPTQRYPRGQFTFNRRFIETKFASFFTVVRRDADKDMVLVVRAARGTFTAQRIARISASDVHLVVQEGVASKEVLVPFLEIQEIIYKHKDAPD